MFYSVKAFTGDGQPIGKDRLTYEQAMYLANKHASRGKVSEVFELVNGKEVSREVVGPGGSDVLRNGA